jgi:hypothetical protein
MSTPPNKRLERTRHQAGFFGELRGRAAQAQRSASFTYDADKVSRLDS